MTAAFALAASTAALAAPPTETGAGKRDLPQTARSVGKGKGLVVRGLVLQGESASSDLELTRFDVWRPDAVIEIDGRRAAIPDTAYFRGSVAGAPGSVAMISVRESGEIQGLVQKDGRSWLVGKGRNQKGLQSRRADEDELPPFDCGVEGMPLEMRLGVDEPAPMGTSSAHTILDQPYVANIAIETDYEYYAKFGNTQNALDYMADLIGYSDVTYSREIDTDMQIGFARLWTTGAANDPWNATGDTSTALTELRNYWNTNMRTVKRTLVQMLSGKGLGGGIAWVGVLCYAHGSPSSSYDYGLSASLGMNFKWDGDQTHNPSSVVWDIMVVQHEIGHNFNSPHTHDYCNIGGSALPIDNCYSGCQSGATIGLPSCTSPTPHYTSGGGTGTIMSYCHLRSGGYGNMAMTFGEGHTCGTLPGRAADRMSAHVVNRAAAYPTCFTPSTCGNGVLDPGEQCDGTNLGGASCASQGFAGGTLSCTSNCSYNTTQCTNCGNNVINAGEVCDGTALGGQTCTTQGCTGGGSLSCNATCSGYNKSACVNCPICDGDGKCEAGETCTGCPSDCIGGSTSGAVCGNGVCEAGNGEDCVSCPSDCNGVQSGKPAGRYCCGDGDGSGAIPCSDSRCSTGGRTCTTVPVVPSSYCCGDGVCGGPESCSTCGIDCGAPAEICGNGIDDNCNGQVDCADGACSSSPSCQCGSNGSSCTSNSQCCSGKCQTKGKNANKCG